MSRRCARPSGASGARSTSGIWPVAGCDEAGRGPLAGPVVAAAVVLDPERIPRGLNDSKKLDAAAREKLYEKICATAEVAVAFGSTARIDRDNILRASLWALARAVKALPVTPRLVFVDGNIKIDCGCDCQAVVSGDALIASVAAASIVAKVTRDRLMTRLGLAFPGYGFERHMGYSVPEHFAALARLGADRAPPQILRAGGRQACRAGRRLRRGRRRVVASLAGVLYSWFCFIPPRLRGGWRAKRAGWGRSPQFRGNPTRLRASRGVTLRFQGRDNRAGPCITSR